VLELVIIPAIPLTMAAGVLFGVGPGLVVVSLASTGAAALAFLIARYAARDKVSCGPFPAGFSLPARNRAFAGWCRHTGAFDLFRRDELQSRRRLRGWQRTIKSSQRSIGRSARTASRCDRGRIRAP